MVAVTSGNPTDEDGSPGERHRGDIEVSNRAVAIT
jgi:hypothetical protein